MGGIQTTCGAVWRTYVPEENGDGKVQKEWVFVRNSDGVAFTLYDWKSGDENYATTMNQTWNVGSKVYAGEFVNDLITILKKKTNMAKYVFYFSQGPVYGTHPYL